MQFVSPSNKDDADDDDDDEDHICALACLIVFWVRLRNIGAN